ncbi:MAG: hypothetical protein JNL98_09125 [Bryobacterales bacterium]|nr:hypothetical protein [Bryobacterales bacterium]
MSVWPTSPTLPILHGLEGDLLSVRVTAEAFLLEDLLETLAEAPFPINPEIQHHAELVKDGQPAPAAYVEFPVWRQRVPEIRALLAARGFDQVVISSMLEEILK